MDKRFLKRLPFKLFIKYGKEKPSFVGFSIDISKTGIYLKSNIAFSTNTDLVLKVTLPDGKIIGLKGRVVWEKKLPVEGNSPDGIGMGIKITQTDPAYLSFIKEESRKKM
ncbi:MAG TPA: PilZ domain-containing protein [Nitrospiria bacterium]|jgi:Tfp pilus assembly protein PilZ